MRLEIDVHWVQRGGKDPVRTLAKCAGLVDLVHVEDYRIGELDLCVFEALRNGDHARFTEAFAGVVQFGEVGEGSLEWARSSRWATSICPDRRGPAFPKGCSNDGTHSWAPRVGRPTM